MSGCLHFGYHSDIDNGKTPGQAGSHTGTSFLAGAATATPFAFDLAYDNIDWVGDQIDRVGEAVTSALNPPNWGWGKKWMEQ